MIIFIKEKGMLNRVEIEDILYVEQDGRYINLVTENKAYHIFGKKVSTVESIDDDRFMRCHSYLIINITKVVEIKNNEIRFENGSVLGMGNASIGKIRNKLRKSSNFKVI